MIPFMVFVFFVKDLKNQLTALSEENISLESQAKKLRTALERAEETQEVRPSVSSGQVRALQLLYCLNEAISARPQSRDTGHCRIVVVWHHRHTTDVLN